MTSSKAADPGSIHGLDVQVGLEDAPTWDRFSQDKCGAHRRQFQVEAGVILNYLRGSDQPLGPSGWIPMHWLDPSRQDYLRILDRISGIDNEVYILPILLPVKIEDFPVVDRYIGFDKLQKRLVQRIGNRLAFGIHFRGNFLALTLFGV